MQSAPSTERRTLVALIGDLFFESRLVPITGRAGGRLRLVHSLDQLRDALAEPPALVLINLAMRTPDPNEAIALAKAQTDAPVVAFGPHKDVEARRQALAAGADRWLPNSKLVSDLQVLVATAFSGGAIVEEATTFDDE